MGFIVLSMMLFGFYQNCGSPGGDGKGQLAIGSADEDPGDPPFNLPVMPPAPPTTTTCGNNCKPCSATIEVLGKFNNVVPNSYNHIAISPPTSWSVATLDECKLNIVAYVRSKLCDTGFMGNPDRIVWWRTGDSTTTNGTIPFTFDGVKQLRFQECAFICDGANEKEWGACSDPRSLSQ